MSDIIVVARLDPAPSFYGGEYINIPVITLPANNFEVDGKTLREVLEERDSQLDPITINETEDSPETTMIGVSKSEAAAVAAALANVGNNEDLSNSFDEMVAKNVKLRVEVVNTAPADFESTQAGGVRFPATQAPDGTQSFAENSEVVITVVGSRLNDAAYGDLSFRSVLAHELAHLMRDSSGKFLTDVSGDTYNEDGQLQRDLFEGFKAKDFLDSPDIVSDVTQADPGGIYGPQYGLPGTNANNYLMGPVFSAMGTISTADGNDIVLLPGGAHQVAVTHVGTKLIYCAGGMNTLIYPTGTDLRDAKYERIGDDLYISFGDEISALLEDNVVVLMRFFQEGYFLTAHVYGGDPQNPAHFKTFYGLEV